MGKPIREFILLELNYILKFSISVFSVLSTCAIMYAAFWLIQIMFLSLGSQDDVFMIFIKTVEKFFLLLLFISFTVAKCVRILRDLS